MKNFFKHVWEILKEVKGNFKQSNPIVHSAAIAFFTIFSLPAISIILTLIGSAFFSKEAVRNEIVKEVRDLVSKEAAEQVSTVIDNALEVPAGFWGVLIGLLVVLQSSSIIFIIIQKALNAIWHVKIREDVSTLRLLRHRLVSLAMVIGLGLLFTLTLFIDTILALLNEKLLDIFEEHLTPALRTINTIVYLSIIFIFFTAIHKVLPDVKVSWKDALAGGVITSILFLIGKQLINYMLGNIQIVGIYAAAGSLVVLLLWVFYSSVILLLGAEVTKAYSHHRGRKTEAIEIAEVIK